MASILLRGDPCLPFDVAAAIVVGLAALTPAFPVAASRALGTVISRAAVGRLRRDALCGLPVAFQLSARPWLMLLYGVLYGAMVWKVDLLAALPIIAPDPGRARARATPGRAAFNAQRIYRRSKRPRVRSSSYTRPCSERSAFHASSCADARTGFRAVRPTATGHSSVTIVLSAVADAGPEPLAIEAEQLIEGGDADLWEMLLHFW